jgi:hypothetical protein
MVFIPLLVFKLVPDFHSEYGLLQTALAQRTGLKPFLPILGTSTRDMPSK